MQRGTWYVLVGASVALVTVAVWQNRQGMEVPATKFEQKTDKQLAYEEIVVITKQSDEKRQRPQKLSDTLTKMIGDDPDYVVVCLGVEEAKGFPGISDEDAKKILAKAEKDSAGAVKDLQKCVYDNLAPHIKQAFGDADRGHRQGWNNNNHATALLLIEFPLAEKLGNKKAMLLERLGPTNQGFDGWVKSVPGSYSDWWYHGIWPWPNEAPPKYWASAK